MRLLLDTNRYVDACRGVREVGDHLARADAVYLPFIVVAELRAGFAVGAKSRVNERALQRFLALPRIDLLLATEATTLHYALLYRQLREQGTPIPTNDLWIAALAAENRLTLYSRDVHFDQLPQLDRLA